MWTQKFKSHLKNAKSHIKYFLFIIDNKVLSSKRNNIGAEMFLWSNSYYQIHEESLEQNSIIVNQTYF